MDNLLVVSTGTEIDLAKIRLSELLTTTDLGVCSYLKRIKFEKSRDGLFSLQKAYTK